ncbi:MAG: pyruvate kinase [bacterium]|nr:pyruvate kinase [bacterium]
MGRQSRSQIVVTVGPASTDVSTILRMIAGGMDVARINFSHGTHESNGGHIQNIREAAKKAGKTIPIIQDLAGPRMKTDVGHAFNSKETEIVTQKDISDLDFGIKEGVEYIAQSYVGTAEDIRTLRRAIQERGAKIHIVAKIERREAVENFDAILEEADAIMVARGDLGLNVPIEEIPFLEKEMVGKAKKAGKPVIVATEMMYSMVESNRPTRAEVTDIAYAILIGSDAVMLSDETARGKHPVEAVEIMEKIVSRSEVTAKTGSINSL